MEDLLGFVAVLFIVFGILQIILFFKIWGMTNNVEELKKKYAPNYYNKVRRYILLGDKQKAAGLIVDEFFRKIDSGYFDSAKLELERDLKKIGIKIPEGIANLHSRNDFFGIF